MQQIKLTQGKFTLVDDEDFEWLNQFRWHYHTNGAERIVTINKKRFHVFMHNVILKTPKGFFGDHEDLNNLNNQRYNLRVATRQQNGVNRKRQPQNKSGYKGVAWNKLHEKWHAYIYNMGKQIHLGYFLTKKEAAKAYDQESKKLFGEFSRPNII